MRSDSIIVKRSEKERKGGYGGSKKIGTGIKGFERISRGCLTNTVRSSSISLFL